MTSILCIYTKVTDNLESSLNLFFKDASRRRRRKHDRSPQIRPFYVTNFLRQKWNLQTMLLRKLCYVHIVFIQCLLFSNINLNLISLESILISWPRLSTLWKITVKTNDGFDCIPSDSKEPKPVHPWLWNFKQDVSSISQMRQWIPDSNYWFRKQFLKQVQNL